MKLFLITLGSILVVGLVALGIWALFFRTTVPVQPGQTGGSFPVSTTTQGPPPQTLSNDPQAVQALSSQLSTTTPYSYFGTVTVMPYALQNWGDENAGNQALLKYDGSKWVVLSKGGGAWDVQSLEQYGVPSNIAAQLIAGEN